jgi:acyl carrier protein
MTIESRVIEIVRPCLPAPRSAVALTCNSNLRTDLGIDSVGFMSVALRMVEVFELDASAAIEPLLAANTVEDLVVLAQSNRRPQAK